jgi:hypothetical protein
MTRCFSLAIAAAILACVSSANAQTVSGKKAQIADTTGKVCRMEQQCHWENFKKICTWVKVCR